MNTKPAVLPDETADTLRDMLDAAPAMLWLGDTDGHCVFLNRAQREFWGVKHADLSDFDWGTTLHPDDGAVLYGPYSQAMRDHSSFEIAARYRRADGAWRLMKTIARPRFDAGGKFLGMIGVNADITDAVQTEAALRRAGEQLETALGAAGDVGTWIWDLSLDIVRCDHRMAHIFGLGEADRNQAVPVERLFARILDEDRPHVRAAIEAAIQARHQYRCEFRVMGPHDTFRWVMSTGRCESEPDVPARFFAGVTIDITDRKDSEEATAMMSRELSHRIKNVFTVVQMMTTVGAREDPAAAPALHRLAERFMAMDAAYTCVTPAEGRDAPKAGSVHALLDRLFAPYVTAGAPRIGVHGPDLPLHQDAATSLALIMHELATNAVKYGALAGGGSVTVTITQHTDSTCSFDWVEIGGPALAQVPSVEGFGSRLIRSSVANLHASVSQEWRTDGLRWRMVVPQDRLSVLLAK
ncbi:MAG: PAS domain-containing protein [Pseudomonadota bacterium]